MTLRAFERLDEAVDFYNRLPFSRKHIWDLDDVLLVEWDEERNI